MTTALWLLLKRVPYQVYAALTGALIMTAILWWHTHAVSTAYQRGRADVTREAAAVAPVYRDRVVRLAGKTDTTIRTVVKRIATVDTLIQLVPDSIRVLVPSVDTALRACTALARDCDQLRADVLTERVARDSLEGSIATITIAKTDTIRHLSRRPTRRTAGVVATVAALIGFFVGSR
jgi:hypothetical protein